MKKSSKMEMKKGQTLITLLVFIVVAISITTASTMVLMDSSLNASKLQVGTSALHVAESGIDNALIRLLRDPTYAGETLVVGPDSTDTAVITVTTTSPTTKTITSVGTSGRSKRTVQVFVGTANGVLVVTPPWKED